MPIDQENIDALKQFSEFVGKAKQLRKQWQDYCSQQFAKSAPKEFEDYLQGFNRALEELLSTTKLKPKRWADFRHDQDLLVEKLTRNAFAQNSRGQIAYYSAELVVATKFLEWLFSKSQVDMSIIRQRWATDTLDDIEVFTYRLVKLISKRLNVQWHFMTLRPTNIWAGNFRGMLKDFSSAGLTDWRFVPPLIRAALERAFVEPVFSGRNITVTNKYIPWEELYGRLKGLSFRKAFPQLDKLLYIYHWASVHAHWGRRYSVGACWFIANYIRNLKIDHILRKWLQDNEQKCEELLQKLERDGYIRRSS